MSTIIEHIQAVLTTTPERWQRLVGMFPAELLTRPPVTGEWSAINCLGHLLDAERVLFPVRVQAFLADQDFNAFDPQKSLDETSVQTPEQMVIAFTNARQDSLALLKRLTNDDLERTVQHPQFGRVTLAQMLHTWAAHDLMHTVQAERALMQPFMDGCGPWRSFFRDHEVRIQNEEQ